MRLRRNFSVVAGLLAGVLVAGAGASAAQADPSDRWGTLYNQKASRGNAGRVLSISGGMSAGAGADAILYAPSWRTDGRPAGDQEWIKVDAPLSYRGDIFSLRSAGTSNQFALSVKGNSHANGAQLVQWWYDPNNEYQQWKLTNTAPPQYKNIATGNCLAVEDGGNPSAPPRAKVIMWDCGSGLDQRWDLDYSR